MTNSKHIIAVVGPTAVGKTARAIEIAQKFQTEIVSADSRQVYREMNIGVARPSVEELSAVPHHFIASHSIHQPLTAGQFEREALETLSNLFQVHDTVVVVGGSGLYIKALVEGLDNLPKDDQVRAGLMEEGESVGWDQLSKKLEELDPEYARTADLKNPRRLVRALEVMAITGKKFSELRLKAALERPFTTTYENMEMDRSELYDRINRRVDDMMELGLLEEVRTLISFQRLEPLQTVGYAEFFPYFDGEYSLDFAVDKVKQHSRNYAKRQLTWFKHQI